MNKKKLEISKLNEREHELGHLVLKKVERHFDMEKNEGGKNKYYNRVKS